MVSKKQPAAAGEEVQAEESPEEAAKREAKEIVQLKFLQSSNKEQMHKLFKLWKREPVVIHHMLSKITFPTHMRSQRTKLSASGQAIGGSMLVGRRVGFSGTPSDLLPKELGKCDYETGDDGKMLTTVLDSSVAAFDFLPEKWDVQFLLQRIATSTKPVFHALIDTGALITGYSNEQVARELLRRGLPWCDGVVFLDSLDRRQVLVRATGRVVSEDQCGISLDRRFAFYDQIHTTGMDIKHVVNARAVVTLGKDMVFRDYVQGAFRMRGIGAGQTITVWVIPEVAELMAKELGKATSAEKDASLVNTAQHDPLRRTLVDIAAWLVINSMRTEQIQWNMLCLQNVSNIYRKNAFKAVRQDYKALLPSATKTFEPTTKMDPEKSLTLFTEDIDFSVEGSVPDPVPFYERLEGMLKEHEQFIFTAEEREIGEEVLREVGKYTLLDESSQKLETEQEREQEQEQEKEVKARRDQQIEVEKFVDREYSRNGETPTAWHIRELGRADGTVEDPHPFYPLSRFKLRYQEPLPFPTSLKVSRNYFNPNWTGLRRVKNVVMVLEWTPSESAVSVVPPEQVRALNLLDATQTKAFEKSFHLLNFHAAEGAELSAVDLVNAVRAATDYKLSAESVQELIREFGDPKTNTISMVGFKAAITSGRLRAVHYGRYWVAVSLAEAETLRRILHVSQGKPLLDGLDIEAALRYSPMSAPGAPVAGDSGVIFDASTGWTKGTVAVTGCTPYQSAVAHNCMRFFDCDMHFPESALNILLTSIQQSLLTERELFFQSNIGARRRMDRKWQETPLAKVFSVADEWAVLKQNAYCSFMFEAIARKHLTLWEAYTGFDADNSGMLDPAELFGAFLWLGANDCTPEDIVDFMGAVDLNQDGLVDYNEYVAALGKAGEEPEEGSGKRANLPPKIDPHGADVLREVMSKRKRDEMTRRREDQLRRQVHQQTMDMKIYEEELLESRNRQGGANPSIFDEFMGDPGSQQSARVAEFRFTTSQTPLRLIAYGKYVFQKLHPPEPSDPITMNCPQGHELRDYGAGGLSRHYRYYGMPSSECSVCLGKAKKSTMCRSCIYTVCEDCNKRWQKKKTEESRIYLDNETVIACQESCSFSLQVPRGAIPVQADNPQTTQIVQTKHFSVSLELKLSKLPPKNVKCALIRFAPPEMSRTRRRHRSHVYLDYRGAVLTKEGDLGTACLLKPETWHLVTVTVDSELGHVKAYVDGVECSDTKHAELEECTLRHKLIVLGGGKQAEARGGMVRRVLVHSDVLSAPVVQHLAQRSQAQIEGKRFLIWLDEVEAGGCSTECSAKLAAFHKAVQKLEKTQDANFSLLKFKNADVALFFLQKYPSRVDCVCAIGDIEGLKNEKQALANCMRFFKKFQDFVQKKGNYPKDMQMLIISELSEACGSEGQEACHKMGLKVITPQSNLTSVMISAVRKGERVMSRISPPSPPSPEYNPKPPEYNPW